ncbi:MAG: aldehyde dehydrogenase family protein, partial [Candidatus Acidiferrales bacterium]
MATAQTTVKRPEFTNEPFVDFSKPENRKAMEEALKKVKGELGREYPILIAGDKIEAKEKTKSINPSRPSEVVGVFQKADAALASRAVEEAHKAFDAWKRVPYEQRAECLFRAA